MNSRLLTYCNLNFIGYEEAWEFQHELLQLRKEKKITDVFLLLEHPHTYTLGKTADKKNLVGSKEYLEENKISVFEIDRGGDITYHGPGQIVGYPIINLNEWHNDTHKYLRALEEVIILTCKEYGLETGRNPKYTGVWIENRKIAAIGIKISNWISMHGFAFNINTDLQLFNGIIPCGITDKEVTSLEKELGKEVSIEEVKEKLLKHFIEVFQYGTIETVQKDKFILLA
ncbi:MAG: lipoyl(octanoyl) transferase LipB [Ignavibacteria bacterium]|nr:lipoyl(octanoyl) transferase LipB [Ignavibacteria bacterium]